MNDSKSAGVDRVSIKAIKIISPYITKPLEHIINKSLIEGIFPEHLKKAEVIPVFKSGEDKKATNYRPISLISNFAKIYEKILKDRINSFITKHDIINYYQFGFQKGKNTEGAIKIVTDQICEAIDDNIPCISIFLDLAKAFDTVNHKILLEKLYNYGFRGTAQKIIESYLSNRKQVVKINDTTSDELTITCGVPQGTILGPILFILYINDLFEILSQGELISFADDTCLIVKGNSWIESQIKAELKLNLIKNWLNKNYLSLNVNKTVFITYGSYLDSVPQNITLKVHTNSCSDNKCDCPCVNRVTVAKYLGVYIDYNLKWREHIRYITNKVRYLIYVFYKLNSVISKKQLMTMYYALFWTISTYGIIAWGGAYENTLKSLNEIQKKILKLIHKKNRTFSTETLYREEKIITIRKYFLEKSLIDNFSNIKTKFQELLEKGKRNKRVTPPNYKKDISRHNHYFISFRIFNLLREDIKISDINKKRNKKLIRDWIIDINTDIVKSFFKAHL